MAGRTYNVRLRGDAQNVASAFGTAGQAVASFARLLGPGGVAYGAIRGFTAALNPLTVGLGLAGAAVLSFARDSIRAFSDVRQAAVNASLSVHRSVGQMRNDLANMPEEPVDPFR